MTGDSRSVARTTTFACGPTGARQRQWAQALRRVALAGLLCFRSVVAQPVDQLPPPDVIEPGAVYAVPTRIDKVGRVLAPVMVNGVGPFRFILDTGANRSVLSPKAAARLNLVPSAETSIGVHGVTGSAVMPAVEIESLTTGDLLIARKRRMPVLPERVLADADGILGVEGLSSARIEIDFRADTVKIIKSSGRPSADAMLSIPVNLRHNGLLMTQARVGRQRVKAIIDTGAERTLGNLALRDALKLIPKRPEEFVVTTVMGATPALAEGSSFIAPTIVLGDAEIRNLEVTFGDLHVFRIWDLDQEPAILIGMDLLGTVERVVIDYRRREIRIKP